MFSGELTDIDFQEKIGEMNADELQLFAVAVRDFLINSVAVTGGHLASNLGVVELTLALHKVFDVTKDRLIWDVGHQSYVHKILTDRAGDFKTLRSYGGISGFPKTAEHPTDVYNSGHSSSSISAAMGMAEARDKTGGDENVIAVIGDGALTGGLAFEGLQNVGTRKSKVLIILNDNQMSISKSKGSLSQHLSRLRSSQSYLLTKQKIKSNLKNLPGVGKPIYHGAEKVKKLMRNSIVSGSMFEELGLNYYGPVDGHSISTLISIFEAVKKIDGPVLLHVVTQKGKGYINAEQNPGKFHGIGSFDVETGAELGEKKATYSNVAGHIVTEIAENDRRIVAITAAMTDGVGLAGFAMKYPERFYDVGIAEGHAVTFAAGLAMGNMRPFVFVYSTFLQRAYDQIMLDVCAQNLPVVFMIDRAGVVGKDGETHHGIFDLSYLSHIPNLIIMSPSDGDELALMIRSSLAYGCPVAIRYPRGNADLSNLEKINSLMGETVGLQKFDYDNHVFEIGKSVRLLEGTDVEIRAVGSMVKTALETATFLSDSGISCSVVYDRFVKPIDEASLLEAANKNILVVTLEDNVISGGFGNEVSSFYARASLEPHLLTLGWPDEFIPHGDSEVLYLKYGLSSSAISVRIEEAFRKLNSGRERA
ncbi:MAG: 1-deoxy-D-xylulose-5-phosphate synthase [Clostridiales Family XIII bacterium]|nr:1-deoxy-D-xylulose-5-phosphate synthase [Clostridiales Family XIII bacterium]